VPAPLDGNDGSTLLASYRGTRQRAEPHGGAPILVAAVKAFVGPITVSRAIDPASRPGLQVTIDDDDRHVTA